MHRTLTIRKGTAEDIPGIRAVVHAAFEGAGEANLVDGDIGKEETAVKVVDAALKHFDRIDLLVNNAGIYMPKPFTETFPMSKANDALDRLRSGKARYRIVLANDI